MNTPTPITAKVAAFHGLRTKALCEVADAEDAYRERHPFGGEIDLVYIEAVASRLSKTLAEIIDLPNHTNLPLGLERDQFREAVCDLVMDMVGAEAGAVIRAQVRMETNPVAAVREMRQASVTDFQSNANPSQRS